MRSILFSLVMILSLSATCQLIPAAAITPIDKREKYIDSLVAMIGNKRIVAIGKTPMVQAIFMISVQPLPSDSYAKKALLLSFLKTHMRI